MKFEKIFCNPPRVRLLPMDVLQARPCEVDGLSALFHRWVEEDRAILSIEVLCRFDDQVSMHRRFLADGVIPPGCAVDVLRETFALVEFRDGTVHKVKPEDVRFVDRKEI